MAMSKIKALQIWCKRTLDGYRDVSITDMTTSWRSGLAFCAMIHKYRPDLINYDSLDKENVYDNNKLAFDVAEKELGITALLEASDMVAMKVPDRLSVITYVAQYHNYFKDKPVLGGPGISVCNKSAPLGGGLKRHHEGSEPTSRPEVKRFTPSHENKQDKAQEKPKHQRLASMGETCQICGGKVYLLERQIDGGKLYHRSCFRHSDMSPSSKVYARPSVLSSRKDEQDREVKGMKALGNGFAAPSRRKSPERKSPRVALNMDTDSEPSIVSSHKLELADSKRNGHNVNELHKFENGSSENKIRSVGKKFEELEKPDWRNKRSQSPVTNLYNRPAERLADQPKLNGHSESTVKEKWPPVSDKKVPSDLSTQNGVNNTPKPRPRQSLQKADEEVAAESSSVSKSRNVESIGDRTEANSALEELQKRRSSPRKLPLALQSTPKEITETEHSDFHKTNKKGNATETTSRQRMFLKKNEQKNGSTEKLNKTMADRIKESKAKSNLRNTEEKSKISKESRTKGASREDLRTKSSSKEDLRMKGSSREDLATKSSSKEDLRMKTSSREDLRTKSSSKEGLRIKSSREDLRTKSSSRDDLTSNVSSRGGLRTPSRSVPSPDETSPPPLPRSTPPERPSVSPQSARVTSPPPRPSRSPAVSPTSPSPVPAPRSAPPKPPRTKQSSPVPMEVDVMTQASQWTPGSEPVAVMVYPDTKSPEEADQQVLGGLLKSLANVRQRPSELPSRPEQLTETRPTVISPTRHKLPSTSPVKPSSNLDTRVAGNNNKNSQDKTHKVLHDAHSHLSEQKLPQTGRTNETVDTTPIPAWQKEVARRKAEKEAKSKQRPKSSTSILDYQKGKDLATESKAIVPQRERSRVPNIPAVDTTPAPALQKDVRRGKDKETRPPRPKSVEVLSDDQGGLDIGEDNLRVLNDMKKERKTQQNKKGKAALKSTEDVNKNVKNSLPAEEPIPDWQKEAQKRMEARKDNFVDPEKVRVVPEKHTNKKDKMPLEDELDKISASDKPNKISAITGKDRKQHHERPSTETHQNGTKAIHERHKPERHDRKKVDFNGKKNVANSDQHHQVVDTKSHSEENRVVTKPTKLKVSPGIKFNFDDNSSLESSTELSPRKGRQPPPRPKSPPHVNRALKHNRITPNKHTPPRIGVSPGKLSPMEIQRQLMDIDTKLTDLELKGRCLEDSIRNAQEDEEDVLMIDWFVLVSQKNDLVRQEADLIYAARENELEEEQDNVQDQLRQLLDKPDKTKEDKQEEEYLLGKLLDIVDQRSKIVDSIDDDKHRYEEEDREIAIVLEKKANRRSQERLL